jgi:hypothetical protein
MIQPKEALQRLWVALHEQGPHFRAADVMAALIHIERLEAELERVQIALPRIALSLRMAGADLPAPEIAGTPESGITTGLSIALALVEQEITIAGGGGE